MEDSRPQIVICGSIAIDRIMSFPGKYRDFIHPEKLHALSLSTLLDKLEDSPGGNGANISYYLAQLGEKPILIGSVGPDGKGYIADLAKMGIDTSHVHFSRLPTASFNVITDSEDSQVGGFYQGDMSDSQTDSFKAWQHKNDLDMVSVHNPAAMKAQVQECSNLGLRLVYDPGQQVIDSTVDLEAGIKAAELLFINAYELGILCHKVSQTPEELKRRLPLMITPLGKHGSVIEGQKVDAPLQIGIAKAPQLVDPTGAGDAYRAGFLYGYLRQWDLKTCGQLGATVASLSVENHGTQAQFSLQVVKDRYRQNFNEEVEL